MSHHHSLSHPAAAPRRHVKHSSDVPKSRLPLTPPLTPSSSINSAANAPTPLPTRPDADTRIVLLSCLAPALEPALLEHTIHQILAPPSQKPRIKGLNTRALPATHSVPVVFFDSRDARAVFDAVSSGTPLLHPLANSPDAPVRVHMISVTQLLKDMGPSPFLDSIDAAFHLRVHLESPPKQINLPILQGLLSSFGQLRTFAPESNPEIDLDAETPPTLIYHIEYFDSRDGHRAILELDGKVFFAMTLAVHPVSINPTPQGPDDDWGDDETEHEGLQTLKNIEFPSISTPPSSSHGSHADADTCEKPEVAVADSACAPVGIRFGIGPPGSASNLRVRFRSLGFGEVKDTGAPVTTAAVTSSAEVEDNEREVEAEAKPTVLYASSPFPLPLGSGSLLSDGEPRVPLDTASATATRTGMDAPDLTTTNNPPSAQWDDALPSSSSSSPSSAGPTAPDLEATTRLGTPSGPHTPCYTGNDTPITPDMCIYCPSSEGGHYPPPPPPPMPMSVPAGGAHTPVVAPSYVHYGMPQNLSDSGISAAPPPDSGMVYYPSLSVTPAPAHIQPMTATTTMTGYEYLEAHYGAVMQHTNMVGAGPSAPGWGSYDPSSMMMPLPMGMGGVNMNIGMGMVPLPMGVNMNMNMNLSGVGMGIPPPHGYYDGGHGGSGRGYVVPYGHPPPHPQSQCQSQYQPQYANMNGAGGVYGHLQPTQPPQQQYPNPNPRFAAEGGRGTPPSLTSRSGSGSSVGSSMGSGGRGKINGSCAYHQGRGTPPPLTGTGTGKLGLRTSFRMLGYKERDREGRLSEHRPQGLRRGCSCSKEREVGDGSSPAPTSHLGGVHYHDDDDDDTVSTSPCVVTADPTTPTCGPAAPNERNQLNIKRIEEGVDTRTTVMIKNIPNKMSDRDLTVFIERVCPRRIDFFYLRMDFQNGCNVGYAFVNFIHVQDLLRFAKARLGVKWNMFSSEKVLQMSYANYQGKEALVEKFKNSAIMDEREAWRPRIFYSSGPSQGLPEPFPPPTHMRRKERSFFNRGALFVPGSGGGGGVGERMSGGGGEGRRGARFGKDGAEGLLTMRGLSGVGVGGLTFGKSWMGRTTVMMAAAATARNGAGAATGLGEGEEEFGNV